MVNIDIFKIIYYILDIGIKLSVSTGAIFNPTYQERTHAVTDIVQQESNKYEYNFKYSSTEWLPTFIKKGE